MINILEKTGCEQVAAGSYNAVTNRFVLDYADSVKSALVNGKPLEPEEDLDDARDKPVIKHQCPCQALPPEVDPNILIQILNQKMAELEMWDI